MISTQWPPPGQLSVSGDSAFSSQTLGIACSLFGRVFFFLQENPDGKPRNQGVSLFFTQNSAALSPTGGGVRQTRSTPPDSVFERSATVESPRPREIENRVSAIQSSKHFETSAKSLGTLLGTLVVAVV